MLKTLFTPRDLKTLLTQKECSRRQCVMDAYLRAQGIKSLEDEKKKADLKARNLRSEVEVDKHFNDKTEIVLDLYLANQTIA